MPFYVVLARQATEGRVASLGILLGASSLATLGSGWVWGRLADRSSRTTIIVAGLAAGIVGCLTAGISTLVLSVTANLWLYGGLFFLLGLAHTGIRIGRKTYLIDLAPGEQRASYVAVSNTVIGILLLASGSIGSLAGSLGARGIILLFALLGIGGGLLGLTLRNVEED
jgi:MFS family permease